MGESRISVGIKIIMGTKQYMASEKAPLGALFLINKSVMFVIETNRLKKAIVVSERLVA